MFFFLLNKKMTGSIVLENICEKKTGNSEKEVEKFKKVLCSTSDMI